MLFKKKKIKRLLIKAAFKENHVRWQRRQETTTEPRPFRGAFLSWSSSLPLGQQATVAGAAELEALGGVNRPPARGTDPQEALGRRSLQR